MQLPVITLPRAMAPTHQRATQAGVPPTRAERERLQLLAARYVADEAPTIPLSFAELRGHADALIGRAEIDAKFRDYAAVVINSEANRVALASVPFERRLLLLPKCLRVEDRCPAPFDDFGLLCKNCGLCTIQDLQSEAEKLGYAVLVAEGSALVMAIIQTGKIDAIIGVSCLSVLEKAFPYMEAAAIPGVAVPLLQDDCKDTGIDVEWVWDFIHLTSDDRTFRLDLDAVRSEVETWFAPDSLASILGAPESSPEELAQEWLAQAGKRWRPFLVACAWQALQADPAAPFTDDVKRLAVAVECFHKASLIHDDIEDGDLTRYGAATLHAAHGVPVALNVGDLLLGEGYRLIAETDASPEVRAEMGRIAARGHRTLCLGQGVELAWANDRRPLSPGEVAAIHQRKTAPAFEVALRLGAALAGAPAELHAVLTEYSNALGVAYQIRDDLDDVGGDDPSDLEAGRPAFPLASATERAKGDDRAALEAVWRHDPGRPGADEAREIVTRLGGIERAEAVLESYKEQAVRALADVTNPTLKGLLRRVIGKIFQARVEGWCREFEARNAPGGAPGAEAARGLDPARA